MAATEYKYYAQGVGCVKEVEPDAQLPLVLHQTVKVTDETGHNDRT